MFNIFKRKNQKSSLPPQSNHKGIVGTYYENDFPVIVKFVNEVPDKNFIKSYSWFTVISWKYEDNERNGMPHESTNARMIKLEKILESSFELNNISKHAYSRTGNNLKELNYYIKNREEFMKQFNEVLKNLETYPIEINFFEDPEWVELKNLIKDFVKK